MTNPYYNFSPRFIPGTTVRSDEVNFQYDAIVAGFDLFPAVPASIVLGTTTVGVESGSGNAFVVTMPNTRLTNTDKDEVIFRATHTNTGAATIAIDGVPAVPLCRFDFTPVQAGDVTTGQFYAARYDSASTKFLIVYPTLQTNVGVITYAAPTALVGPTAVVGAAATVMRSDAAPAINLTANYAWTGIHSFLTSPIGVASGGTGLAVGTSGGVLGYTAAGVLASSVVLTNNAIVLGRGAGATPAPLASLGTVTTVLHGNAAGDPTFGAVSLTTDVSGVLPITNGGTGAASAAAALTSLGAVPATRNLTAGTGLTGGGDLSADRTFNVGAGTGITVAADTVGLDTASTRNTDHTAVVLTAGAGLTGGGDISASRTFDVGAGAGITVNANDVALDTANTRNVDHATVSLLAGAGLTGGGVITAGTITFDVGAGTGINVLANAVGLDTTSTLNTDHAAVSITGVTSLTGGGTITASRTLSLVNDSASPGNSKYYGTDSGGTKGFFAVSTLTGFKIASGRVVGNALQSDSIGVTSVTPLGGGLYTINFTAAGFSTIPACVASARTDTLGQVNVIHIDATSATSASIVYFIQGTGGADSDFQFICVGT